MERNDTTLQTRSTLAKHTNVEQNKPNNNEIVKWSLVSVNGIVVKKCLELIHSFNNTQRFIAIVIHFHITTPQSMTIYCNCFFPQNDNSSILSLNNTCGI